ncbi:MAG: type II toxin-antitoxin system Phd/YefM family antitoxin [Nitrospinae bacterium]|nr:type II toxin-antitoxin system Phd/YefM family antitoxin [Nitrospinota bacterium]
MIELHPEILEKNGKKEFVILTYEEFLAIQEALEDAEDLRDLRAAKQEDAGKPGMSIEKVKERYS